MRAAKTLRRQTGHRPTTLSKEFRTHCNQHKTLGAILKNLR